MGDWKQKIEAQIALAEQRHNAYPMKESEELLATLKALYDVAVAAEKVVNEDDSYWNVTFDLNEPLDKLREVGDE